MVNFIGKRTRALTLKVLSFILPIIALAYVGGKIWSIRFQIRDSVDLGRLAPIILVGGVLYAIDNLFLVLAWRRFIHWIGKTNITWKASFQIYGRTQIAKYIPGNIFQFPGRHLMGLQAGIENRPLLGAAVFEIIGLFVAASLVSLPGFLGEETRAVSLFWIVLIFLVGISFPLVLRVIFSRVPALRKNDLFPGTAYNAYKELFAAWLMYLVFFILTGVILWGITIGLGVSWSDGALFTFFSAYALSWLVGTITPGAPGGAGVREAMMIMILSSSLGEPASVVVALISRLVTVAGDVFFYFIAQTIR